MFPGESAAVEQSGGTGATAGELQFRVTRHTPRPPRGQRRVLTPPMEDFASAGKKRKLDTQTPVHITTSDAGGKHLCLPYTELHSLSISPQCTCTRVDLMFSLAENLQNINLDGYSWLCNCHFVPSPPPTYTAPPPPSATTYSAVWPGVIFPSQQHSFRNTQDEGTQVGTN